MNQQIRRAELNALSVNYFSMSFMYLYLECLLEEIWHWKKHEFFYIATYYHDRDALQ